MEEPGFPEVVGPEAAPRELIDKEHTMAMQPPPIPPDPRQSMSAPPPAPAAAGPAKAPPQPGAVAQAQGQAGPVPVPPDEFVAVECSFWQQPFVQNVLPFLTSLVLHVSLILLGVLTLKAVQHVYNENPEQMIIPEAEMFEGEGDPTGLPNPGLGGDPTRRAEQDQFPDVPKDSQGIAERPGANLIPSLAGGGGGDAEGAAIIGVAFGGTGIGKGSGLGAGSGTGAGSGDGDGTGVLAPFGVPGGGSNIGPRAGFIGLRGNARRIAYVCDASGSMLEMFDSLRVEIRKSVENLRPVQSFNVIFFQDRAASAADRTSLMPATPEAKRRAYDFLDQVSPRGSTDPIPALEMAFRQRPELIYLLTDGDFEGPGNEAVVEYCRRMTADGKIKINTIAFVSRQDRNDPQQLAFVKALQEISKNSGGRFKHVTDDDMGH
jgi:hypothetical protein